MYVKKTAPKSLPYLFPFILFPVPVSNSKLLLLPTMFYSICVLPWLYLLLAMSDDKRGRETSPVDGEKSPSRTLLGIFLKVYRINVKR